jgi:hypothetical protein
MGIFGFVQADWSSVRNFTDIRIKVRGEDTEKVLLSLP